MMMMMMRSLLCWGLNKMKKSWKIMKCRSYNYDIFCSHLSFIFWICYSVSNFIGSDDVNVEFKSAEWMSLELCPFNLTPECWWNISLLSSLGFKVRSNSDWPTSNGDGELRQKDFDGVENVSLLFIECMGLPTTESLSPVVARLSLSSVK